jgi:hypothetical protein
MAILADIQHSICQDNSGIFRGFPSTLADHLADVLASAMALSSQHDQLIGEFPRTSGLSTVMYVGF